MKAGRELKEAFTKLSEGHFNDHVVNQGIGLCLHYRLIKVVLRTLNLHDSLDLDETHPGEEFQR